MADNIENETNNLGNTVKQLNMLENATQILSKDFNSKLGAKLKEMAQFEIPISLPPVEPPPTYFLDIPRIDYPQERMNDLLYEQNQTLREHLDEAKKINQKLNIQYSLLQKEFSNNEIELIKTKNLNHFSLALNIVMFIIAVFSLLIAFFDLF